MYTIRDEKYASAIWELAQESGNEEEYIDFLKKVVELAKGCKKYDDIIKRYRSYTQSIKDEYSLATRDDMFCVIENILKILIEQEELERIIFIWKCTNDSYNLSIGKRVVNIKTAARLNNSQKKRITEALKKVFDIQNVELIEEVDKEVIAGVYVESQGTVIDNTILGEVERIRSYLLHERRV